jgi:inhibitor of cysteine peptidase
MRRFLILVCLVALAACGGRAPAGEDGGEVANPASVYCEQQGGTVEIRTDDEGGQVGVCVFDDGSECEEWAFYRGECEPGTGSTGER